MVVVPSPQEMAMLVPWIGRVMMSLTAVVRQVVTNEVVSDCAAASPTVVIRMASAMAAEMMAVVLGGQCRSMRLAYPARRELFRIIDIFKGAIY